MRTEEQILAEYRQSYDIDTLSTPNDRANLRTLVNNQIVIDNLQEKINTLIKQDDILDNIGDLKKLQDALSDIIDRSLALERALGIDRKSRKRDNQESVVEYINNLKITGRDWLEKQFIRAFCPKCKIMVGRIIPVHEHTAFDIKFQCSQCNKWVTVKRDEKDIFFDLKERNKEWRRKHPIEVIAPEERKDEEYEDTIYLEEGDTKRLGEDD